MRACHLFALVGGLLLSSYAAANVSAIEQYWLQSKEGDPLMDVKAALDAAGPLVMATEIDGVQIEVYWDSSSQTFALYEDDLWVGDALTYDDKWGRPAFKGHISPFGIPQLEGFADLDEEDRVVIRWIRVGMEPAQLQLTDGEVTEMARCRCSGTGGTVFLTCAAANCDDTDEC